LALYFTLVARFIIHDRAFNIVSRRLPAYDVGSARSHHTHSLYSHATSRELSSAVAPRDVRLIARACTSARSAGRRTNPPSRRHSSRGTGTCTRPTRRPPGIRRSRARRQGTCRCPSRRRSSSGSSAAPSRRSDPSLRPAESPCKWATLPGTRRTPSRRRSSSGRGTGRTRPTRRRRRSQRRRGCRPDRPSTFRPHSCPNSWPR